MKVQMMGIGGGCQRYRLDLPALCLLGEVEVVLSTNLQVRYDDPRVGTFTDVKPVDDDVDVVVVQRPTLKYIVDAIPLLQARGVAVVVETDDDLGAIEPDHVGYLPAHRWGEWNHADQLARACRLADLVTVSTSELRRYREDAVVLPNYVDAEWLNVAREPGDEVIVGWTGTTPTHPGDLEVASAAVQTLDPDDFTFVNVGGDAERVGQRLGIAVEQRPWCEFDTYPLAVAEFDVGIVPLSERPFNHAKSWVKGLEYAALGVPFVASPVTEYLRLWRRGAGLLASTSDEWYAYLSRLVKDNEYRVEMGQQAREAAAGLVIQAHAHLWAEAWSEALRRRRG